MSNPKKIHIQSAVQQNGGLSRVNLSHHVLASAKIGQILPIFHRECVPGDKFRVQSSEFSRFEKLAVPSYVTLNYRTMSVFVPYHQVMDGAESFFSNQQYFKGKTNSLPLIKAANLVAFLTDNEVSTLDPEAVRPDFWFSNNPRTFTALGRYCAKVLRLLGYGWYSAVDPKTGERIGSDNLAAIDQNALPLLSFCHAYNCYLSYSVEYNISALSTLLENLKRAPSTAISATYLKTLLFNILLTYEESFFSMCWKKPFGITESTPYGFKQLDTTLNADDVENATYDATYGATPLGGAETVFSAQQIRLILKADDYFRRTNFCGSKDIEQIFSRFGVRIDDYKTRYPYFLNESERSVRVGDVTSTSTTNDELGAYAGKAISDGDSAFNFDCKDYGMLFTFAWFSPKPIYYQGLDKEVLRLQPFDFYTPEFDQGFADAVKKGELSCAAGSLNQDFGFHRLYAQYLVARDYIVGDFTRYAGFAAWHFGREDVRTLTAQSDNLIYMSNAGTEFERIFNITEPELQDTDVDTIYMVVNNAVSASRPMKDFSGKASLGEGDLDVPELGSQMN